jgi:hypothetical protein
MESVCDGAMPRDLMPRLRCDTVMRVNWNN